MEDGDGWTCPGQVTARTGGVQRLDEGAVGGQLVGVLPCGNDASAEPVVFRWGGIKTLERSEEEVDVGEISSETPRLFKNLSAHGEYLSHRVIHRQLQPLLILWLR